jgi:ribosome-associated toxin RatA of RatAB toxin-antitoxin module
VRNHAELQNPGKQTTSRRRFLLGAAVAAGALITPLGVAAQTNPPGLAQVSVERHGSEIVVEAHAEVDAGVGQTWSTLADYDRLAEFIPDMASSRTVARTGGSAVVEQEAQASFGPFRQNFRLVLAVEEAPGESIHAIALDGDFRRFDARYDIAAIDAQRTRIDYRATLEPTGGVPPLFGVPVMRSMIRRQFEAMLGEIGRRASTRLSGGGQ